MDRYPTCGASGNLSVEDGYLLRGFDIPDESCERLARGYSFFWRRDFSQLHFGDYECQSWSSQRRPGEFLKRLHVLDGLSILNAGAASYGSDICRAGSGGPVAARSLIT